jgi:pyruvate/2-oxoglutarate dehydrogenase complex dihydrolipoamide acyltransferase (E2) component
MAYEFKLPDLGEGVREGEVARWLVEVGQEVAEDEPLVEIQTDKTTVAVDAPTSGTLVHILRGEFETVPVAEVIAVIDETGQDGFVSDRDVLSGMPEEAPAPSASETVTELSPMRDVVRIGTGRDASEVPFATFFGTARLRRLSALIEAAPEGAGLTPLQTPTSGILLAA